MITMTTTYSAPVAHKGKKPYKSWLKDGVSGGPCSMDILVRWLSLKANFAKWRGDESERTPKKLLLESILDTMRDHGIHHRLAKDIASKISTLQSNYRTAREWNDTEGKRLRDAGTEEDTVHEELLKRFPYWDALHETFGTRTSSWPMSISSIMHRVEEEQLEQHLLRQERRRRQRSQQAESSQRSSSARQLDDDVDELVDDEETTQTPPHFVRNKLYTMNSDNHQQRPRRRRRLSDSTLHTATNSATLLLQQQNDHTQQQQQQQQQPTNYQHHRHQHDSSSSYFSQKPSQHQQQQPLSSPTTSTSSASSASSSSSSTSSAASLSLTLNVSSPSTLLQPMIIRPMPRSFQHPRQVGDSIKQETPSLPTPSSPPPSLLQQQETHRHHHHHHHNQQPSNHQSLADSLVLVTREKEAGRMKRSQEMLEFLREKRQDNEQLLMEKEKTRRIKAKAELVKNMLDAGFTKDEISEQLQRL